MTGIASYNLPKNIIIHLILFIFFFETKGLLRCHARHKDFLWPVTVRLNAYDGYLMTGMTRGGYPSSILKIFYAEIIIKVRFLNIFIR